MISPMVSAAINFPRLEGTASPLSLIDIAHTRTASVLLLYLSLQPRAEKTHASSAGLTLQYCPQIQSYLGTSGVDRLASGSTLLPAPVSWGSWEYQYLLASFSSLIWPLQWVILASVSVKAGGYQRRRHLGFPGRREWGHPVRGEFQKFWHLFSQREPLSSEIILPLTALPNPERCCSRPVASEKQSLHLYSRRAVSNHKPKALHFLFQLPMCKVGNQCPDSGCTYPFTITGKTAGTPALGRQRQEGCHKFKVILSEYQGQKGPHNQAILKE